MPTFSSDGVDIHYQVAGEGFPLLWSHEFAGDITSWEPQVNFFSRRYRVITYCHRGYPPSGVPDDPAAYSQDHLVEDLRRLLQHLGIEQAYIGSSPATTLMPSLPSISQPSLQRTTLAV